jgi:TrmH RNA methyltransferase
LIHKLFQENFILIKRPHSKKKFPAKKTAFKKPAARKPTADKPPFRKPMTAKPAMRKTVSRTVTDETSPPPEAPVKKSFAKPLKEQEFTVYGMNACMAVFKNRPEDIRRVFFSEERSASMGAIKRWCQKNKLPYRELDLKSLYKVAASAHHEGVVMVVNPKALQSAHGLLRNPIGKDAVMMALDRVGDTHNLGAILRSSAFFGVQALVLGDHEDQAKITSSAARMAEGALEMVPMYQSSDLASALRDLRAKKVFVIGADASGGQSLYDAKISFPCIVVVGNENQGLSEKVKKRCHALVQVPGASDMQSLNVSVATGVILAELNRRKNLSTKRKNKS